MMTFRPGGLRTLLCLGAHADDIEIGCGGAVLRLVSEYAPLNVCWVVLSAEERRAEEARRSARLFLREAGEARVEVLSFRDSFFPYDGAAIKGCFHELSRSISPDLIFTHRRDDAHQDHRLTAELTWNAFRNHAIWEYEIPKYDGDLGRPNVYVPVSEEICRRKLEALAEGFPSQQVKPWFSDETFRGLMRLRGVECNSPSGYAEAFHCRKLVL
jgi:LmbE family N-acetylglucosaminyl deacetylase